MSLETRQGRDKTRRWTNVNARPGDASSDDRQSFAEVLSPPPARGTAQFNLVNPTLSDALLQSRQPFGRFNNLLRTIWQQLQAIHNIIIIIIMDFI